MMDVDIDLHDGFNPGKKMFGVKILLRLFERLFGNPQKDMDFVHITGTNGKGSTSTMISSVLTSAGYQTGLFISPSVRRFMERIQVNKEPMSASEFLKLRDYILEHAPGIIKEEFGINKQLSEFSIATLIAFKHFKDSLCNVGVIEVGIGGDKDATNVIDSPLVSVITSVAIDHVKTLGSTVEEIARRKCGIIKKGCPVVVAPGQKDSVYDIIRNDALKKSAEFIIADPSNIEVISSDIENGTKFKYKGLELSMNLLGDHQLSNALTALTAINIVKRNLDIPDSAIKEGISSAFISARLEVISRSPLIILDGAHNESGLSSLTAFLKKYLPDKKLIGIVGMCRDKNPASTFQELLPLFSQILPVEIPHFGRSCSLEMITERVKPFSKDVLPMQDLTEAVNYARDKCDADSAVIIFGSLYLARKVLREKRLPFYSRA